MLSDVQVAVHVSECPVDRTFFAYATNTQLTSRTNHEPTTFYTHLLVRVSPAVSVSGSNTSKARLFAEARNRLLEQTGRARQIGGSRSASPYVMDNVTVCSYGRGTFKQGLDRVLERHCTLTFGPEAHSLAIQRSLPNDRERHPDPRRCQSRSLESRAQRGKYTHAHTSHRIQRAASFKKICTCRQGMRASQNAKASHHQAKRAAPSRQCLVD